MSGLMNGGELLLISAEGYERRQRELDRLRNDERRELYASLRDARRDGDLADNPALQGLLEEQAQLERRIFRLESELAAAEIVEPGDDGRAGIGNTVRVRDNEGATFEYELVGPLESDAENGRVSIAAPVGEALLGQGPGARIALTAPHGPLSLRILSVRAGTPAGPDAR
jgi:transcription elongation factor GreA